ncbi:hypothetical protein K432DRAFT_358611 [Lepidopterella palustris CBS 459.81]|uniref:R3H domain-containing protein n=1 Tax=Lepidopterella palustris CBS 459.81 TaxID=1314670 RepID=A0A8E2E4U2_9PEZI|nr:hypothetical protein K432DRAFT_358611 [Lepidopterella palustris CBS 459.81]
MSATAEAPQTQAQIPTGPARRPPRRRRPQNRISQDTQAEPQTEDNTQRHNQGAGRGVGQANPTQDAALAFRLASIPPRTQSQSREPSSADISTTENPAPQRNRRGRAGGGQSQQKGGESNTGKQGAPNSQNHAAQHARPVRTLPGGRRFGGELTVDIGDTGSTITPTHSVGSPLHADAPDFRPGQPHSHKPTAPRNQRPPQQRKRRASKSSAPDISTRTHEDIDNGHYECAICTEEVRRNSRVWSCRTCWTVFHLSCIKKWSTNEGSAAARREAQGGDLPPPRQWRCPGCNLPKDALPNAFSCWCEKEMDPKSLPGLPPFSCGQTCSRPRVLPKKCPHPCPSVCHSGPCPPCTQMGPTQSCFCGKRSITRRCIDTDYENGWSCGDPCGELMPCGEHLCTRPCHEGLCGACEVRVPARCYCGQIEKEILCCDRGDEKKSSHLHTVDDGSTIVEEWIGLFECGNICQREFDCGKHACSKGCHRQDAESPHCPRSPDVVSHCPCGKTPLDEISTKTRHTCEDPIPNCSKPCGKVLPCTHECMQHCHQGECMPCLQKVTISCRCGRTSSPTICHQGTEESPQCLRICRVSLNCGRHECGERCCPGERKAGERQSSKRKPRPLHSAPRQPEDGFEAEHICTRTCDRLLKCGNPTHRCQELCHKGACGTCREAIFDEISCNCGRTVLQPPLPCGTKPPPCRLQCNRHKSCGHPQVPHNCHLDEESCPKCPFLTTKLCLCGKNTLKNQPCWLNEVRCGQICGRKLKCGAHRCQKQCHRSGQCEEPCQQSCGKELAICGHDCLAPCHSPYPCKEEKPCQHKIFITCDCQRIKQEAKCNASRSGEGNGKKSLKCDDECARLERNRKLALALNIDTSSHQDDHIPYAADTLKMYQENVSWASIREKEFRVFAANPAEKRLRFKPMPSNQRAFLHALAEDFGFDSESMDPEPHRHVAIFKTPRFVMAPMKTLAECIRIRQSQRAATAMAPAPAASQLRMKASNVVGDPYNGFILTNPRFGLTIEELRATLKHVLDPIAGLEFDISFLPSEEVALRPSPGSNLPDRELEALLKSLKPTLSKSLTSSSLGSLRLCRIDPFLNIQRREEDSAVEAGWSQVAAKGSAPMRGVRRPQAVGTKSAFTVLSLSKGKKKNEAAKKLSVVDDWEEAELMEEEREKMESGGSADEVGESDGSRVKVANGREDGSPSSGEDADGTPRAGTGNHGIGVAEPTMEPFKGRWADIDDDE